MSSTLRLIHGLIHGSLRPHSGLSLPGVIYCNHLRKWKPFPRNWEEAGAHLHRVWSPKLFSQAPQRSNESRGCHLASFCAWIFQQVGATPAKTATDLRFIPQAPGLLKQSAVWAPTGERHSRQVAKVWALREGTMVWRNNRNRPERNSWRRSGVVFRR